MFFSYGELLDTGISMLKTAGLSDARTDAEWLLLDVIRKSRDFLFLHREEHCAADQSERYFQYLERRVTGEPVQYITGSQEFMGLPFDVSPAVLIPRQDTEILVESALAAARENNIRRILDMCSGSGAIAVSCAVFLPEAEVTACDISGDALAVARQNAEKNGVSERISFLKSDLFSVFRESRTFEAIPLFDMFLCNPPYIPTEVIAGLQKEISEHEPVSALDGGQDGLDFYRILAAESWQYIKDGGNLFLEIGDDQAEAVQHLFRENGYYEDMQVIRDLAGRDRVIRCRKKL